MCTHHPGVWRWRWADPRTSMASRPNLTGELWPMREGLPQKTNNKNSSLGMTPRLPPALNSHDLIPACTPKNGDREWRRKGEIEGEGGKTEGKEDPRKNDIIKLRVRVQGQASSGEKTCLQYYYDTGQYVCPHGFLLL